MWELRSIVKKTIAPNSTKNRSFTDTTSPAQGNFVHRQCPVRSFSHTSNLPNWKSPTHKWRNNGHESLMTSSDSLRPPYCGTQNTPNRISSSPWERARLQSWSSSWTEKASQNLAYFFSPLRCDILISRAICCLVDYRVDCGIFITEITRVIKCMQLVLGCRASAHGSRYAFVLSAFNAVFCLIEI